MMENVEVEVELRVPRIYTTRRLKALADLGLWESCTNSARLVDGQLSGVLT